MIKVICVAGARPNFMKIAPLMRAFKEYGNFDVRLVHTGQQGIFNKRKYSCFGW